MPRSSSTDITRGENLELTVDGQRIRVCAGETLATAVLASDTLTFNRTGGQQPRSAYCNMGTCFECQVRVAPAPGTRFRWQRACMVPAQAGMVVLTGVSRQSTGEEHDG
ncbi:MAG: (2Fe-2S)-binding protein [Pseudomonadota bacterium]